LTTKISELDIKLKLDIDNNQKLEQKKRELQHTVDEQKEKIETLEKEKEEMETEKLENTKAIAQLNLDLNELTNQVIILNGKGDQQDVEINSLKQRIEEHQTSLTKLKDEGKQLDSKLSDLSNQLEAEKNEKSAFLRQLGKLDETISQLKKKN